MNHCVASYIKNAKIRYAVTSPSQAMNSGWEIVVESDSYFDMQAERDRLMEAAGYYNNGEMGAAGIEWITVEQIEKNINRPKLAVYAITFDEYVEYMRFKNENPQSYLVYIGAYFSALRAGKLDEAISANLHCVESFEKWAAANGVEVL